MPAIERISDRFAVSLRVFRHSCVGHPHQQPTGNSVRTKAMVAPYRPRLGRSET